MNNVKYAKEEDSSIDGKRGCRLDSLNMEFLYNKLYIIRFNSKFIKAKGKRA